MSGTCGSAHLTPLDLADQAIGLFLEYRDQHGRDELSARAAATLEVAEGAAVTDDEIAVRVPQPASEEAPVYAKTRHGNNLWLITYDEGWRSGVLCSDMYEADADFLLSVLGRTPRGVR